MTGIRVATLCGILFALSPHPREPAAHAQNAAPPAAVDSGAAWRQNVLAWRAQREKELSASDGWLTLIGMDWLRPGVNAVGSAADCAVRLPSQAPAHLGLLTVSGKPPRQIVQLLAPAGGFPEGLTVDGAPAREGPIAAEGAKPSAIAWHGLSMMVLDRGGRYAMRVKDANSPARSTFHGLRWYDPDPRLRITAQWTPLRPAKIEKIPTVLGTTLDLPSPGFAEFMLDGKTYRLHPVIEAGDERELFFILRDQTSETTTYNIGRYLHSDLPDRGVEEPGKVVLDFNLLYNPPCAYTTFATCPLPPEENRLPVTIPAGEQRYLR